jgi:hypothetical protein
MILLGGALPAEMRLRNIITLTVMSLGYPKVGRRLSMAELLPF